MNLHYHYTPQPGYTELVTPDTHPVEYLHFAILTLAPGQSYEMASADNEVGLVLLSGTCDISVNHKTFARLGGRASVWDGRATGVYAPPQAHIDVRADAAPVELAICQCRTNESFPARVVRPDDVVVHEVGGPGFKRYVHDILGTQMSAGSLIVGETFTVEGNWSSFPPHKHDVEALPDEVRQEELYFYKVRPVSGFGIQYLYSHPESPRGALDLPLAVRENDITLLPYGYHPVAAPPGYDVYYLWFLSGPTRLMRPHDDPAHAWIKEPRLEPRTYPQ